MLMSRAAMAAFAAMTSGEALALEWDVSLWGQRRASTEHVHKLAELVEEKTGGEFTLNVHYGDLANPRENLDGISIGAFQMAQFCAGYHPDKNPSLTVLELPFLGISTLEEAVAVRQAVYDHPSVKEDMGRWKATLLMPTPLPQYNLAGTGEPRDTIEEFAGMRVRATGGIGETFEAAGAVPNALTASETLDAMKAGVVDSVAFAPDAHLAVNTIDLTAWWTENLDLGTEECPIVVNAEAHDGLSPEHREALDGSIGEAIAHYIQTYDGLLSEWDAMLGDKAVQRIRIGDEEIAKLRAIAGSVREQWLTDMKAQGVPGQELHDLVQKTVEEERSGRNAKP